MYHAEALNQEEKYARLEKFLDPSQTGDKTLRIGNGPTYREAEDGDEEYKVEKESDDIQLGLVNIPLKQAYQQTVRSWQEAAASDRAFILANDRTLSALSLQVMETVHELCRPLERTKWKAADW